MAKGRQTVHLPQQRSRKHEEPAAATAAGDKAVGDQPVSLPKLWSTIGLALALLTVAAVNSPVSQATLAPVFGALPSRVNHAETITATVLLGYVWRAFLKSTHTADIVPYLAFWALWMPSVQHYVFQYSSYLGPIAGPIVQGFLSCHTIIIACAYAAAQALEPLGLQEQLGQIGGVAIPAVALDLLYFRPVEHGLRHYIWPWLTAVSDAFTPVRVQLVEAASIVLLSPSRPYWLFTLGTPALLHAFLGNPHFDGPYNVAVVNRDLAPLNWTLLDRAWSTTGYLAVLESQDQHYRVLRCDHSLLGGEWLLTDERRTTQGWKVNEPIYSVFQMLEAVRLVEREQTPVRDSEAQALVVGLGVGTAPKALMAHGINTTIVEIDPVVHRFATEYFGLPRHGADSGHIVLDDAVAWASRTAGAGATQYDYIVHDVFTGGAEPLALFSDAFLADLRAMLAPDGVIALNYAGDLHASLTAQTLHTIDRVFSGQCKIYRDAPPPSSSSSTSSTSTSSRSSSPSSSSSDAPDDAAAAEGDFVNMVVFCRQTAGPIRFRAPTPADFLGSKSRRHYLLPRAELELAFPAPRPTNASAADAAEWAAQQEESAIRHWHIMRRVLPAKVWELW